MRKEIKNQINSMFELLEVRVVDLAEMIDSLFYQQIDLFHWQLHSIDSIQIDSIQRPLNEEYLHRKIKHEVTH